MSGAAPRRGRGTKRSSQDTYRRRLFLLRHLMAGPADGPALVAAARAAFGIDDIYPVQAREALRHDLRALRDEFGCAIRYSPACGYTLDSPGDLALLELPPAELEALCFLHESFAASAMPDAEAIVALVQRLVRLLPPAQQRIFAAARPLPRVERPQLDPDVPPQLLARLRRAVRHQRIRFDYRSTYSDDLVAHQVDPYDLLVRDGATYLEGYCRACSVPALAGQYHLYRVGRIAPGSLAVLPEALPPGEWPRHRYRLRYALSPVIARRRDVARWFSETTIAYHDDGGATVTASTSDLWHARQVLLRYRDECLVLEPPELAEMIRDTAARLLARYGDGQPP